MVFFVEVILPIPLRQTFTYSVNRDEAAFLKKGMRVAVPFGKSKIYTGIVYGIHQNVPIGYEVKSIDHILEESPLVTAEQLAHWEWIADYYMCSMGEVIKAAMPNTFLLESETIVRLSGKKEIHHKLSEEENLVLHTLSHQSSIHLDALNKILTKKTAVSVVKSLIEKELIEVEEAVYEKYTPKLKKYIRLHPNYGSDVKLQELLELVSNAPKQKEVLLTYFMLKAQSAKPIGISELQKQANASTSVISALLEKEILQEFSVQQDRIIFEGEEISQTKQLNSDQQQAFDFIKDSFASHDIVLLHGVTSSGKTEVYVNLIKEQIEAGKQVLYMLPEIALTTQLIRRLQRYFGENVSVYHSQYTLNERTEVWKNVLEAKPKAQIIVGARSSLFLPFRNLGLIVVDEEHETSFKQFDPAPRYNARDSAIMMARIHGAKTLLGSATPSLESFLNAKLGRYGFVELLKRYGDVPMPEIQIVDIREKTKKKLMTGHFSDTLLSEMQQVLKDGEQIILFQNRRGFSPVVECTTCGTSPQCPNCDVSLTYHQKKNQLRCHYCGYHMVMMMDCIACGSATLDTKGFGTEQIETELKALFPDHAIARMDQDTTRGKHAYSKLLDALDNEEIDILVGTQMLAKGLDFRKIGLVGVMNADSLLHFPDFRAHERSYQLLSQVAGRAGRTKKKGKVLIQTYNPLHQILQQVSTNNYREMSKEQLEERYQFKYPPYYRLIRIEFKDKNFDRVEKAAQWFAQGLRQNFDSNVLGPEQPPIGRIRNQYIFNILLKISKKQNLDNTKNYIQKLVNHFQVVKQFSSVRVNIDVDPY
ncbi:MAG TPA: primosomal protein N' [Flavobacteriaceae bacterium]|nr:primosomal protein N' [Flavobacteriaceae bacterium]